jgi:GGDEF domain-containing protein
VNRQSGREQGDAALIDCARSWRTELREEDYIARVDGKRFGILMPHTGTGEANELLRAVQRATPTELRLTVGLVSWDGSENAAALETRADQALQRDRRRPRFASRADGYLTGRPVDEAPNDSAGYATGPLGR